MSERADAAFGDHSSALTLARTGGDRTKNDIERLAAELLAGGEAEAVGLRSLRGYSPSYVEIDGVPVECPQPERKEAPGVRVRRANGEIALYLTTTMERARFLLDEARKIAEAHRG